MKEILDQILDFIYTIFFDNRWLLVGIIAGIIALIFAIKYLIQGFAHIARDGRKVFIMPHRHFKAKHKLLCNSVIVEFYSPAKPLKIDLAEGEKPPARWLSFFHPYSSAIRASFKRNRVSRTQKFLAQRQIREVARQIYVLPLTKNQAKVYDPKTTFRVKFYLSGRKRSEVEGFKDNVKSTLKAHTVRISRDDREVASITFIVCLTKPKDPLSEQVLDKSFYDEHPAQNEKRYPLAVTDDGKIWRYSVSHTLIVGQTGAGKGSVAQGIIYRSLDYVKQGTIKLYGIDPKNAEYKAYGLTNIFTELSLNNETAGEVIEAVHREMERRGEIIKPDFDNYDMGRSIGKPSKKFPLVLLIIDELPTLLDFLNDRNASGQYGKIVLRKLYAILAMGRSHNIFAIMSSQMAKEEKLKDIRTNLQTLICLRIDPSDHFNDFMLGVNASKNGFRAYEIPLHDDNAGISSAGIGYVKRAEGGDPIKMRFPYLSDKDLITAMLEKGEKSKEKNLEDLMTKNVTPDEINKAQDPINSNDYSLPDLSDLM